MLHIHTYVLDPVQTRFGVVVFVSIAAKIKEERRSVEGKKKCIVANKCIYVLQFQYVFNIY